MRRTHTHNGFASKAVVSLFPLQEKCQEKNNVKERKRGKGGGKEKSRKKQPARMEKRKSIKVHVVARVTRFSRAVGVCDTKVRGGVRDEAEVGV